MLLNIFTTILARGQIFCLAKRCTPPTPSVWNRIDRIYVDSIIIFQRRTVSKKSSTMLNDKAQQSIRPFQEEKKKDFSDMCSSWIPLLCVCLQDLFIPFHLHHQQRIPFLTAIQCEHWKVSFLFFFLKNFPQENNSSFLCN